MDFANEIRNSLDTQEVFSNYGLRPNRSGFVCCFLHNEKTPSMKVYKGNGGYHCFGCGAHGSIIDFVMQYFGLNFQDAISKINADFSLGLPIGERISLRQRREMEHRQRERQEERNREQRERERLEVEYWAAFDVLWQNALNMGEFSKPSKKDSNEIGLIMQGFSDWVKQPNPKRFKQFGLQKWWRRGRDWTDGEGEEMLPL